MLESEKKQAITIGRKREFSHHLRSETMSLHK